MNRSKSPASFSASLVFLMMAAGMVHSQVTVTSERRTSALPTNGTFIFTNVPSNSSTDLANGKLFTLLAGTPNATGGPISNLTNGPAQTNSDSVPESFFASGTGNIRVQIDLGAVHSISQINTYSWHANTRAPQVFRVYGATSPTNNAPDFTAADFQNETALATIGYTQIASVNNLSLGSGGQYGSSIGGTIGNHRYLLFDMAPPQWGVGPRPTFFGEIDIYGVPAASEAPRLIIKPRPEPGTGYQLEWNSQAGKRYSLFTNTGLDTPVSLWEPLQVGIAPTPPLNVVHVNPADPRRFYVLGEDVVPPLLFADFEADNGGFSVVTLGGTPWEYGVPNTPTPPEGAVTKANSGTKCWGTNLTGAYSAGTDTSLRSPVIDLTGVTAADLRFVQALDSPAGHTFEVNVLNAAGTAVIANIIPAAGDGNSGSAAWQIVGPLPLPAQAFGQQVRIEWRFIGDGDVTYNGAYIDDVTLSEPAPAP